MADAVLDIAGYYMRADAAGRRMMESLVLALACALAVRAAVHLAPAYASLARRMRSLSGGLRRLRASRASSGGAVRSRLALTAKPGAGTDSQPQTECRPAGCGPGTAREAIRPGGAVAESDFIRNASREDVLALKRMFGFVWAEKAAYDKAASGPEGKAGGFASLLVPVKVDARRNVYPSISLAERLNCLVLTDSANIRRICAGRGVRCLGRGELGGAG